MPVDPTNPALYGFLFGDSLNGTLLNPTPLEEGDPIEKGNVVLDGDPYLFESGEGGNVQIRQGLFLRTGGLCNAVYLSLFDGNIEDSGAPGDFRQFWGNFLTDDTTKHLRAQTQRLLEELPVTSGNLPLLVEAMKNDLQWMLDIGVATEIEAEASILGPNRVELALTINAEGDEQTFKFVENWNARS